MLIFNNNYFFFSPIVELQYYRILKISTYFYFPEYQFTLSQLMLNTYPVTMEDMEEDMEEDTEEDMI